MNAGEFLEANCRIAGMWMIPSPMPHDEVMQSIEGNDELPIGLAEIVQGFGWSDNEIEELLDAQRDAWEAMFDQMICAGKSGWLIKVDTPVYETREGRSGMSYSWGYYNTHVLFAESVTDGLQTAINWSDARYEEAKRKVDAAKEVA